MAEQQWLDEDADDESGELEPDWYPLPDWLDGVEDEEEPEPTDKSADPLDKALTDAFGQGPLFPERIVQALLGKGDFFYTQYDGMTAGQSSAINAMLSRTAGYEGDLSVLTLIEKIQGVVPGTSEGQAENIARTEMTRFVNSGRRLLWSEDEQAGRRWLYEWIGPLDERTTSACKNIHRRTRGGVGFEVFQSIVKEESERWAKETKNAGWRYNDDLVPHFQCRWIAGRVRRMGG